MVQYQGGEGITCLSVKDVSMGGVRLVISRPELPGRRVQLSLYLKESTAVLELRGQVVWARQAEPFEVGVQFLELDDQSARTLAGYVG